MSSVSWTTTPNRILPLCGVALPRCSVGFLKVHGSERAAFCSHIALNRDMRILVSGRNRSSSLRARGGDWEDPDEGSDSDEEDDLDFESNWEEERDVVVATVGTDERPQTSNEYGSDLVQEVEELLEPEEREILRRSATPDLEKISTAKWNPIHTLALSGQIASLDKLLEQGVDIDDVDKEGQTALHASILRNKGDVITHLLRKGASPHVKDKDGATPLHYAAQVGVMPILKLLLKYKVDLNVADDEGWTPLHVAAQTRSKDIVKVLLLNGADRTRRNKDGNTALDISLCYGKDFKSYDLATVLKVVPASRNF